MNYLHDEQEGNRKANSEKSRIRDQYTGSATLNAAAIVGLGSLAILLDCLQLGVGDAEAGMLLQIILILFANTQLIKWKGNDGLGTDSSDL